MTTISYSVAIKNNTYENIIQENDNNSRFNSKFKNVAGDIVVDNLNSKILTDGWHREIKEPTIANNIVEYQTGTIIKDRSKIKTQLSGPTSIPTKKDFSLSSAFINTPKNIFSSKIQTKEFDPSVLIFSNKNNKLSVFKEFEYNDQYSIVQLDRFSFTITNVDGDQYICTGLTDPLFISEIKNSNISFIESDLHMCRNDFSGFLLLHSLSDFDFLQLCQKINIESLPIRNWNTQNYQSSNIILSTEYFPLHKDVSVFVELTTGETIQLSDYSVDCMDGIINLKLTNITEEQFILIKSFYLFYGTLPQIFFNPSAKVAIPYVPSKESSISKLEFNSYLNHSFTPFLSEDNFQLHIEEVSQSHVLKYALPNFGERLFVEADSNLLINNKFLNKNIPMYIDSSFGSIEFKLPNDTIFLLDEFNPESPISTLPYSSIQNDAFALYGLFNEKYGAKRVSLMAGFFDLLGYEDTASIVGSISSYGSSGYGYGGYGGLSPLLSSSIIYGTSMPTVNIDPDMEFVVTFSPAETGNEIILPSWTSKSDIVIYIGDTISNRFLDAKHYEFVEPDILVFKNIDPNKKYTIKFKSLVYPIIQNLILQDNTFDVIIRDGINIKKYYSTLLNTYILSNKDILVRFGYIDSVGKKTYFDNTLIINKIIGKKFFEKNISGLKSFIF